MSEGREAAAPAAFVVFYGRHADRLREALCLALGDIERDRDAAAPVPTRHADLTTRLHRLGVEQRATVVCRYLLDWSVEETAAVLELPVETVESRLARALERLAQAVDDA